MSLGYLLVVISSLCLTSCIQPASCASLDAFWTDRAVQIVAQDPVTGDIIYSSCNSNKTVIFPIEKPNVLEVTLKPRNGTALAAAGWSTDDKIVASIVWQTETNALVNGYYECDNDSGKLVRAGDWDMTAEAEIQDIHNETGLSFNVLGEQEGYRAFYHNQASDVMMLCYTTSTGWVDGGTVSQDRRPGTALASAHHGSRNISVVFPRNKDDIEVSQLWKSPNEWALETFPTPLNDSYTNDTSAGYIFREGDFSPQFALPSWDVDVESIGMSIDASRDRSVFYIGADKKLYQVAENKGKWEMASNRSQEIWPVADEPSSSLAVAYESYKGSVWVYYWSNNSIVQAHMNDTGVWQTAVTLPEEPHKAETKEKTPGPVEPSGLSTGAKAGIGVGVGVGALLAGGLLVLLWMRRRKRRASASVDNADVAEVPASIVVSPVSQFPSPALNSPKKVERAETSEMNGQDQPAELEHNNVYHELPGHDGR
ncbi:hypothetical protein FZEAL_8533 [Fusarium zealandicum]|uniref:Fucose-specific lectin n=1 Tax=Fusarium zealandicum TaxID=1053134 RepID=A0A8H4XHF1_9HYPO|nr:hypothetical protein FZEAL_8533 [Fusarium zealandicum]